MPRTILVLGSSGRTGLHVIEQALAEGHTVRALVRNPAAIHQTHANLTLIQGTPTNARDIENAMQGCDAVISTLNNARRSDSPFAKLVNSDTFLKDIITSTINAMKSLGLTRIAMLGAAGVHDSYDTAPWIMRQMIKRTNLGQAYRDHEAVEDALAASGLDWTVGRAMMLGTKPNITSVVESYVTKACLDPKPQMQISRVSVAKWLVEALDRSDLHSKAPVISQGK